MALGTPASAFTAINGTNVAATTGSFTVTAGEAIYVFVGATGNNPVSQMTISDSQSLTWTPFSQTNVYEPGGNPEMRIQGWRAVSNGNSMTVTITPGATAPAAFTIHGASISSADSDVTNTGFNGNTAGDPAPSLTSAPDASSTVLGFACMAGGSAISPPTNYTELSETTSTARGELVYDAASAAQSATWSSSNNNACALLIEVLEQSSIAYELDVDPGSYTYTGTAATFSKALNMDAAAGSYSLTGTAATLRRGYTIALEAGTYVLTGTAATFHKTLSLIAAAGSYAITGTAVTFTRALSIALEAGSYLITPTDADLIADLREFAAGPVTGQRMTRLPVERRVMRDQRPRRRIIMA